MLNNEEEQRLIGFTDIVNSSKIMKTHPKLGAYDIEWLVVKLKELNDELKERQGYIEDKYGRKIFIERSSVEELTKSHAD